MLINSILYFGGGGFQLEKLSIYRTELMGIATVMILICHASVYGVNLTASLRQIFSLGNLGVEIFFLLSGIGISYSLNSQKSILRWYSKRYVRIGLPYLLIAIPWYVISSILNHDGLTTFLLNVSTMNYWLYHKGAWFVAVLLPLYLISPFLNWLFQRKYSLIWLGILVGCTSLLGLVKPGGIIGNIVFAVHRLPLYFIGMYIAPFIMSKKKINLFYLVVTALAGMFILRSINKGIGWLWPSIIILVPLFCYLMDIFPKFRKILNVFGFISLESYLLNICLGNLIPNFAVDFYGICRYSLILFVGISLALIINRNIVNPAIQRIRL